MVVGQPVEGQRNRLLRRADWRFLLPVPTPRRSVCFAGGSLAESVAAISEELVDRRNAAEECDLAVARHPHARTLRAAWRALRPGAWCYTEWHFPDVLGPGMARRRLEAAGFEDVRCYWVWPLRPPAQFWVPLASPTALRHFLEDQPTFSTPLARGAAVVRRALWRAAVAARFVVPVIAIAQRPTERPAMPTSPPVPRIPDSPSQRRAAPTARTAPALRGELLDLLRAMACSEELLPPEATLSWSLRTFGTASGSKAVGLVFAEPDPVPRLTVKLARVPESSAVLEHEAQTLRAVHLGRPGGMPGVPRVLFLGPVGRTYALGESFLPGKPISWQLRPDNYRGFALAAVDWLAALTNEAPVEPRGSWWDRIVSPALVSFEQSFAPVIDPAMLQRTADLLTTLDRLPIVWEQRDFSPWNVLMDPHGRLAVLDWESAEPQGLPVLDLFYFLTYLGFSLDGAPSSGRYRASYRRSFDASTLSGRTQLDAVDRYREQVGLEHDALPPLRLLTWLIHARSEYRRMAARAGGDPSPEMLSRSLFFSLWREELHRATA